MSLVVFKRNMTQVYKDSKCLPVTLVTYKGIDLVIDKIKSENKSAFIVKRVESKKITRKQNLASKSLNLPENTILLKEITLPEGFTGKNLSDLVNYYVNNNVSLKATGYSKGKGFAGVVKRWGMHGSDTTHGASNKVRAIGSVGAGTTMGRVFKGKRMAGHKGLKITTIRGTKIIDHIKDESILVLNGSLPGSFNSKIILSNYVY